MRSSRKPIPAIADASLSNIDAELEALDKCLDHIVAKILRRGPRDSAAIGPKQKRSGFPGGVGIEAVKWLSAISYIVPSNPKELKAKIPNDVRVATKLMPVQGRGLVNDIEYAQAILCAHPCFSLKIEKPDLNHGRDFTGSPESFSGSTRKEGTMPFGVYSMICDNSLHKCEGSKKRGIPKVKRKRLTVKNRTAEY